MFNINNHKNSILVSSFTLSLVLSSALYAQQRQSNNHQMMQQPHGVQQKLQTKPQTRCDRMRMERQQEINRSPDIELASPLRESSDANCFSPAENLYYIGLIEAEAQLGANASWYKATSEVHHNKAKLTCEVIGYIDAPPSAIEECIAIRYNEMMYHYDEQYRQETADYINKRNALGEELVMQCVTAFYQTLPRLPQQIQLPLAYYDRKLHSYPDWYMEERISDTDWLLNMKNTMASEVIGDALKEQCPGDMIWWLYLST